MLRTAITILVIELALIAWVRRRYAAGAREGLGGERRQQATTSA
jgi:hypothetical protein